MSCSSSSFSPSQYSSSSVFSSNAPADRAIVRSLSCGEFSSTTTRISAFSADPNEDSFQRERDRQIYKILLRQRFDFTAQNIQAYKPKYTTAFTEIPSVLAKQVVDFLSAIEERKESHLVDTPDITREYSLFHAVRQLPDGYLERIIGELHKKDPKPTFNRRDIYDCFVDSLKRKKKENVKFLLCETTILKLKFSSSKEEEQSFIDNLSIEEMGWHALKSVFKDDCDFLHYLEDKIKCKIKDDNDRIKFCLEIIKTGPEEIEIIKENIDYVMESMKKVGIGEKMPGEEIALIMKPLFSSVFSSVLGSALVSESREFVEKIIKEFNINFKDNRFSDSSLIDCFTPLMTLVQDPFISQAQIIDMLEYSKQNGLDLKRLDDLTKILEAAAENNYIEVIKHLMPCLKKLSADDFRYIYECYVIEGAAVRNNNFELVGFLRKIIREAEAPKECLPYSQNFISMTSFVINAAICKNNLRLVKLLLSNVASSDLSLYKIRKPLLIYATERHYIPIIRYLLQKGADVNEFLEMSANVYPIDLAALWGDLELVKEFEKYGAKISKTTFLNAMRSNNIALVRHFVQKEVFDVNDASSGTTPLEMAALKGAWFIAKEFIEKYKGKISGKLLHLAAQSGNVGLVEYLIQKGASFDCLDLVNGYYSNEILRCLKWQKRLRECRAFFSDHCKVISAVAIGAIAFAGIAIRYYVNRDNF